MQIVQRSDIKSALARAIKEASKYPMSGGMDLVVYGIKLSEASYYIGTQLVAKGVKIGDKVTSTRFSRDGIALHVRKGVAKKAA